MKIAIPTYEDKRTVFKRTGHAPLFSIFEDDTFIKAVPNEHAKNHSTHEKHSEEEINHHIKDIRNIKDCDVMLVKVVGKNMSEALKSVGIEIVKIDSNVDDAYIAINEFLKRK